MIKWLHHLFNPHCPECRAEREESRICDSCEVLKLELDRLRLENEKLLDRILEKPTKIEEPVQDTNLKPIMSGTFPWKVRKQMLEAEDREKARILRQLDEKREDLKDKTTGELTIEKLEEELGVSNANQ